MNDDQENAPLKKLEFSVDMQVDDIPKAIQGINNHYLYRLILRRAKLLKLLEINERKMRQEWENLKLRGLNAPQLWKQRDRNCNVHAMKFDQYFLHHHIVNNNGPKTIRDWYVQRKKQGISVNQMVVEIIQYDRDIYHAAKNGEQYAIEIFQKRPKWISPNSIIQKIAAVQAQIAFDKKILEIVEQYDIASILDEHQNSSFLTLVEKVYYAHNYPLQNDWDKQKETNQNQPLLTNG